MSHQDSRLRAEQALKLRACGRSWSEIANALGYGSRRGAAQAVERLLASSRPDPEAERAESTEGLRVLRSTLFARMAVAAQRGDDQTLVSISKELRNLVAEHSKLNGLYAPVKQQVDVRVHQTPEAILERAQAELLAAMRDQPALETIDVEVVK